MSQHNTSGDNQTFNMTPKQLQQSFLEQMPSFERDDDLTVVTTAESIGGKNRNNDVVNNSAPSSPPQEDIAQSSFKYNQAGLGDEDGSAIGSRFASMSIEERGQATPVECIAAPKSSLAIAASRQTLSNQHHVSNLGQNKPSLLSSTISTNFPGSQTLAPPPPGFVSPISLKSERNNLSSNDQIYRNNRDRAFFTDSRVIRRKEGRSRVSNQRHPIQKFNQRSTFENNSFWGTMHDDTSSMPSATIVSSNSHSTVSDTTSLSTWKNSNLRQTQNDNSFQRQYGDAQSSLGSHRNSSGERFNRPNSFKDSTSVSTSFHSLSNESYYQGNNVNSHTVQSILSSPSTLFQKQGLYNVELAQSSSSNSSNFSDYHEAIPGIDNKSYGFQFTSNSDANMSYALRPLMPVKGSQDKILPEISKQLSSSGSGDKAYCEKDDFCKSKSSQSAIRQSPKSKKREWRLKMSRKLAETPVGDLNPDDVPLIALMNVSFLTLFEMHIYDPSF